MNDGDKSGKSGPKNAFSRESRETFTRRAKGQDTLAPASDLVKGLMQNVQSPLSTGFLRLMLEVKWSEIVGARLAKMTAPAAFSDGILDVWVAHSTWIQELWYVKDEIRAKVNKSLQEHGGGPGSRAECRDIRFTLNRRQSGPTENP